MRRGNPIIPARDQVGPDDPLILDVAAKLAFPDGTMSAAGLRRENGRGRLVIERVAGKSYTTLNHIARMRVLCQLSEKAQGSSCDQPVEIAADESPTQPSGSCETVDRMQKAHDAALTTVQALKSISPNTSPANTSRRRRKDNVVRPKFRSPTS